jgi:hypothetical protein
MLAKPVITMAVDANRVPRVSVHARPSQEIEDKGIIPKPRSKHQMLSWCTHLGVYPIKHLRMIVGTL